VEGRRERAEEAHLFGLAFEPSSLLLRSSCLYFSTLNLDALIEARHVERVPGPKSKLLSASSISLSPSCAKEPCLLFDPGPETFHQPQLPSLLLPTHRKSPIHSSPSTLSFPKHTSMDRSHAANSQSGQQHEHEGRGSVGGEDGWKQGNARIVYRELTLSLLLETKKDLSRVEGWGGRSGGVEEREVVTWLEAGRAQHLPIERAPRATSQRKSIHQSTS